MSSPATLVIKPSFSAKGHLSGWFLILPNGTMTAPDTTKKVQAKAKRTINACIAEGRSVIVEAYGANGLLIQKTKHLTSGLVEFIKKPAAAKKVTPKTEAKAEGTKTTPKASTSAVSPDAKAKKMAAGRKKMTAFIKKYQAEHTDATYAQAQEAWKAAKAAKAAKAPKAKTTPKVPKAPKAKTTPKAPKAPKAKTTPAAPAAPVTAEAKAAKAKKAKAAKAKKAKEAKAAAGATTVAASPDAKARKMAVGRKKMAAYIKKFVAANPSATYAQGLEAWKIHKAGGTLKAAAGGGKKGRSVSAKVGSKPKGTKKAKAKSGGSNITALVAQGYSPAAAKRAIAASKL